MYFNDEDDIPQFIERCDEEEMAATFHETCENDEIEVTELGNVADYDVNNISDSVSNDRKSNCEVTISTNLGPKDIGDTCLICDNKVYPMEKMSVNGKLYHKNCFRCCKCRTILSVSNFTVNKNSIYCKTHFMELFKIRGKFDDDGDIQNEIVSGNDAEIIPTIDTKGLLAKFRELESGDGLKPSSCYTGRNNSSSISRYTLDTSDIVNGDLVATDELPQPETAKLMVAKFRAMESNENVPSPTSARKMQQRAKANSNANANVRLQSGQAALVLMEDEYVKEVLPEEGATRNLMSKFQNIS